MRARTAEAIVLLCWAWVLVTFVPLRLWRDRLGGHAGSAVATAGDARRLARHVERGADRLMFATKCLPRAMALSWMLRRRNMAHRLKFAVRPAGSRHAGDDDLHAWVEVAGETILGELPGPWLTTLCLGD